MLNKKNPQATFKNTILNKVKRKQSLLFGNIHGF